MPTAFEDSRRLTGPNLFFAGTGAVLETAPGHPPDPARIARWQAHLAEACQRLGWPLQAVVRRHAAGASLALAAPADQLYTATAVNEWAWQASGGLPWQPDADADAPDEAPPPAPISDEAIALARLQAEAAAEARPGLRALLEAAAAHALPVLLDDTWLTIGSGAGGRSWPLDELPAPEAVPWPALHAVPTALVTGTNGKTTIVRLLAAIGREAGLHSGHSCTDGVYLDGGLVERGDYSGPAGARQVLRRADIGVAILETARGGILRRGLALDRADAAIVTNISEDHFGEYGIDDLAGLAAAKLVVARAVGPQGLLVLPADDPVLAAAAPAGTPIGWFAPDDADPRLAAHRATGGATCGIDAAGRMRLAWPARGIDADLGAAAAMPLTAGGRAGYNLRNLLGAALVAAALGFAPEAIAAVCARFGRDRADNPGRLARWAFGGVTAYVDYAHNPEGLAGLLAVACGDTPPAGGRLLLVLGQAGNRGDAEIAELAAVAARHGPAQVVLKEIEGMLRGRAPGEVPRVLRAALVAAGMPDAAIAGPLGEVEAVRTALAAARQGDVLVLPTHAAEAVAEVHRLLDRLEAGWQAGDPLAAR